SLGLLWIPPDKLKKPFKFITSINLLVILGLAIGLIAGAKGGSLGTLQTSQRQDNLGWSFIHGFAVVFSGNAVGMASHCDFSRFARRPGAQVGGQLFSFLISGNLVPILGIFGTAAAAKMYGDVNELGLWNPPNILQMWLDRHYHNPAMRAATFFVAFGLTSSIMALNSIENGVSGGMDVAGLYPRYFNIRRGSYLLAAVSVLVQPWQIIANGSIFTATLNSFGVILFPLMGTMVADYYIVRKQQMKLSDLYRADPSSIYWFHRGFNWRAFTAWLVGFAPSVPGLAALNPHNTGIPIGLTYTFYLWPIAGFFASFVLHATLSYLSPPEGIGAVDGQDSYGPAYSERSDELPTEFEAELAKPGLAVLDFYSPQCGPCHVIAPLYSKIADDQNAVRFYKVKTALCPLRYMPLLTQKAQVNGLDDAGSQVQRKAEVTWWPTLVVYQDGQEIWRDRVPNPPSSQPLSSLEEYLKVVV
ncbi:hypothetical protein BBP40_011029, partial [Aspergillus hancockii]